VIEVVAPDAHDHLPGPKLFLAGSIDEGRAEPWQSRVVAA
jgi:hypothetical protein